MSEFKELNIDGTIYTTLLNKKFENRKKWSRPDPKEIYSFIPGKVIKLLIKEGQVVAKGEVIIIHQAMKMNNKILMPFDGKIKSILVKEEQQIPNKHLMVIIE